MTTIFPSILPDGDDGDGGDDAPPIASSPIDPTEMTVDELREALADEDYDWDAATLRGLRRAEREGDARQTALDVIDRALDDYDVEE